MKNILMISLPGMNTDDLFKYLKDSELNDLEVILVDTVAEAEEILFSSEICLIILDWNCEGVPDFVNALKTDEMFRLLPVLAILPGDEKETISAAFLSGVDNYLLKANYRDLLPLTIRPLIVNNVLNSELVNKISALQEQAIHDFILLDLIKKYIPRTIWELANNYAYEQKIHIPEEELELTIAFGDIREFTNMSQHLAPRDVIRNLNSVFEIITGVIYAHNGDIDKFIGDAFLGVFREPREAVIAMVKVQKSIEGLNRQRRETGMQEILFRVGIHTGPIIRGNVGGNNRFDNTLIGDTVNTASRLESLSKPGDILISETTRKKAELDIHPENQFKVKLKGKDSEERVYQIYDLLKDKY